MGTPKIVRQFTNFSISEILKPTFGLKYLTQEKLEEAELSVYARENDQRETVIKIESLEDRLSGNSENREHKPEDRARKGPETLDEISNNKSERLLNPSHPIPAWVFCTRYSDRPTAGPRSKRQNKKTSNMNRHRTSFTRQQLNQLTEEFSTCPYLTEITKDRLTKSLKMEESHIKIWFQNKRAKLKRENGRKSALAIELTQHGLYDHQPIQYNALWSRTKQQSKRH